MDRLIIVADDFAGAADCGVAFAAQGISTRALLASEGPIPDGYQVVALDTDTRDASPSLAAERVRRAVAAAGPRDTIFKKVDSTLRGNLAPEVQAAVAGREGVCLIAATAFPEMNRVTRDGRQLLAGDPLECTEFASEVHSSLLAEHLKPAGLPVVEVPLQALRNHGLAEHVERCCADGGGVLACDAENDDDLDTIAQGGIDSGCEIMWLGTAGLSRRLAAVLPLPRQADAPSERGCEKPLLLVVGSPSAATGRQLERLRREPDLTEVILDQAAGDSSAVNEARAAVAEILERGCDCALTLSGGGGAREAGRAGTRRLADVAGAAELCGGLVLTGGETARAVLESMALAGLTLARELRPGIALGYTDGPSSLPVAVKAGGFGDDDALVACREAMRGPGGEQWASR